MVFDGSLSGGGAYLYLPNQQGHLEVARYLATTWSEEDHSLLRLQRGASAHQLVWEAFALLLAIRSWTVYIRTFSAPLQLIGDAQGVLQSVVYGRARQPKVNLLVAEMGLILGFSMHDLQASHWSSEKNSLADALSRSGEGEPIPEFFRNAIEDRPSHVGWKLIGNLFE